MTVAAKQWTTEFKEINDSNEELNATGSFLPARIYWIWRRRRS